MDIPGASVPLLHKGELADKDGNLARLATDDLEKGTVTEFSSDSATVLASLRISGGTTTKARTTGETGESDLPELVSLGPDEHEVLLQDPENPPEPDSNEKNEGSHEAENENEDEEVSVNSQSSIPLESMEAGSESREILLTGRQKRKCRRKRFWFGCCCCSLMVLVLSFFIVFLPVTRAIIASKTKTAPVEVIGAHVHINEKDPVIMSEIEVFTPKSAWDLGFLLRWITFQATVPPVNATVFLHLPNGTVLKSGNFSSKSNMSIKSWEDMHVNFTGVLYPCMDVVQDLVMTVLTQEKMRLHIEAVTDVSAKILGFIPISIPNVAIATGVLSVDAMNNFKGSPIQLVDYVSAVGYEDKLSLKVKVNMTNPTSFATRIDGNITLEAVDFLAIGHERYGRLGAIHMSNMTMQPKQFGPNTLEATFDFAPGSSKDDKAAFDDMLRQIIGTPKGYEPCGTKPLNVSAKAPIHGPAATNPMLNKALSDPKFVVNALTQPKPFTPLEKVEVQVGFLSFTVGMTMYNPLPQRIRLDAVVCEMYHPDINGTDLYTFNETFPETGEDAQFINANGNTILSMEADPSGTHFNFAEIMKILNEALSKDHKVPMGVRGNFTVTVLPDFTMTIPYTNVQIVADIG